MRKSALVEQRKSAFWKMLYGNQGQGVGKRISLEDFAAAASDLSPKLVPKRTAQYTLQQMQREKNPYAGTKLVVGKDHATLDWSDHRVLGERTGHRPQIKQLLGRAAWSILFGTIYSQVEQPTFDLQGSEKALRNVKRKIGALRKKSPVHIFLDAGSSTYACGAQLLQAPSIPLHVSIESDDSKASGGQATGYRLVSPHITTNSPNIATMISDSKHLADIGVTVVGGDQRSERGSICGSLALHWLSACNPSGDVSIIGTTGYRLDAEGQPSFGSDNHEEAEIKAAFMARTWMRVVIFDSSKLTALPVSRVFCPLNEQGLDLVITDNGEDVVEYVQALKKFRADARRADVAVALVGGKAE